MARSRPVETGTMQEGMPGRTGTSISPEMPEAQPRSRNRFTRTLCFFRQRRNLPG